MHLVHNQTRPLLLPVLGGRRAHVSDNMGDGTTRKRRSKTGCSQCRTVSRKCDEVHPRCGRCQRLQFDCAYRTAGLTWKDETPKFTRGPEPEDVWTSRHAQSSDAGLESSSGPPSDADESTLIRHCE